MYQVAPGSPLSLCPGFDSLRVPFSSPHSLPASLVTAKVELHVQPWFLFLRIFRIILWFQALTLISFLQFDLVTVVLLMLRCSQPPRYFLRGNPNFSFYLCVLGSVFCLLQSPWRGTLCMVASPSSIGWAWSRGRSASVGAEAELGGPRQGCCPSLLSPVALFLSLWFPVNLIYWCPD